MSSVTPASLAALNQFSVKTDVVSMMRNLINATQEGDKVKLAQGITDLGKVFIQ